MTQRSARLSRARRGGNRDAAWKKSKPLAYLLIGLIVALWFHTLFLRGRAPKYPEVPVTYICNSCKAVFDLKPSDVPPPTDEFGIACTACAKKEAYAAYECANTSCLEPNGDPFVFPYIPEFTAEEKRQREEMKLQAEKARAEMAAAEGMSPDMMDPMMMDPMYGGGFFVDPTTHPPRCPKCRKLFIDRNTGEQNPDIRVHLSPAAKKLHDERERMIAENAKTKK